MKKILLLAVIAAAVGALVYKKMQDDQDEADLWTEATTDESLDLR